MPDQGFHFCVDKLFFGQDDIGKISNVGTVGEILNSLLDYTKALSHLFHPAKISCVGVPFVGNRYIELIVLVIKIRNGFSNIVRDTASSKYGTGNSKINGLLLAYNGHFLGAVNPYLVPRKKAVYFI